MSIFPRGVDAHRPDPPNLTQSHLATSHCLRFPGSLVYCRDEYARSWRDMNEQLTVERCDALLLPFMEARDPKIAEGLLIQLIQGQADPLIAKILKSKLRVSLSGAHGTQENQDALDIASELRATLIADLRALQQHPDQKSIKSFPDYVAIKTYSACADYFRERNPQRWRLKNRLRYQLKQNSQFVLWKAEDNCWYAGLSEWRDTMSPGASTSPLPSPSKILERFSAKHAKDVSPAELLTEIFADTGHAIEFERVVSLAAEVWNITDPDPESVDNPDRVAPPQLLNSTPAIDLLLEQRFYLEKLWTEVCLLPVLQRAALLLNLRDAQGGSAIFFIPYLGIASQAQIAVNLELPEEEFSALWNDLPLDDSSIATMLGISRQQVINLRKTARERLRRRMEKL
ncbi:MAG TPA: hypothetical protein VGW76_12340 [Pyrinomonadaceae bacterium]|nr:hypothetical protein [Pyrinomonadaceae bacterium]